MKMSEDLRDMQNKMQTIKKIKKESKLTLKGGDKGESNTDGGLNLLEAERQLDDFVMTKKVKLISKDNYEMLDPIMQVFDLLSLQELDLKIRQVNKVQVRKRGKINRGGVKATKKFKKDKQRARSNSISKKDHVSKQMLGLFHDVVKPADAKKQRHNSASALFKTGSKANWNIAHKRYAKQLVGVKDFVKQKQKEDNATAKNHQNTSNPFRIAKEETKGGRESYR